MNTKIKTTKPATRIFIRSAAAWITRIALMAVWSAFISGGMAQAQLIIAGDNFDLNGTTRVTGTALNGLAVTSGTGTWSAYSNTVLSSAGTAVTSTPNTNGYTALGEISFTNPNPTGILTVQADLEMNSTLTHPWSGVGFQTSATPTQTAWLSSANLLWAQLDTTSTTSGKWKIYAGGTSVTVASGTIAGFSRTAVYTFALSYDPVANAAQLLINGTDVSGWKSVSLGGVIGSAGFIEYATDKADSLSVDNFQLSVVPEPGSVVLTLLGGAGVGAILSFRHKKRDEVSAYTIARGRVPASR